MARGPQALDERTAPEQRRLVPTARMAKLLGLLVVPVAVLATGVTVVAASYSSFSSVTSSPSNSWSTGSVVLTNDGVSAALFTSAGLKPGSVGSHCINVTSTGSLASSVKLYAAAPSTTNNLAANIRLVITQGSAAVPVNCTGFAALPTNSAVWDGTLADFSLLTAFGQGVGTWTPTGAASETHSYRIDYTVNASAPNSAQNGTAAVAFTWEAQNS